MPFQARSAELKVIDSSDAPWPSIGRVNVAGYRTTSMCTGTLIAPDIVLTAAHCLYDKRTLRPFSFDDILFIAGVRRDKYAARLEVMCALTANGYEPTRKPKLSDVHKDVGILILKKAATLPPVPALSLPDAGILDRTTRFQSAGYRRSRRYLPTVVPSCQVLQTIDDSWVTDCSTESGVSGGPLLVDTEQGLRVAGVMSAKVDDSRSAIVPFYAWQDLLASKSCDPLTGRNLPALRSSIRP